MSLSVQMRESETTSAAQTVRVLHVHSGNMIGGIESFLRTVAEFAPSCPELVGEIALAFEGAFAASLRERGMTVHILPSVQMRNPLSVLRSRRELQALLDRGHYDAIISHSPWCQVVYGPVMNRLPLVYWMHNDFDGHWLQKLAARNVPDLAICNSKYTAQTLARVYSKTSSTILFYPVAPSAPTNSRGALRRELGVSDSTVVILMASRMEHWKGHFHLLHAASKLPDTSDWHVWIAGGPQTPQEKNYFASVECEVKRNNLEGRVNFLGQRTDVVPLMQAADIFCQPNASAEPFGVVFIEALYAGLPIVTFDMGGPSEILQNGAGVLVNPGDDVALAAELKQLIDDAQIRASFRTQGPIRARQLCDPAQQLRGLYKIVSQVTHKNRGGTT